jgi:hypothetical protein
MLVYLLYNRSTSGERTVARLHDRLKAEQVDVELLDADSPRGIQLTETYDIMGRPAVVVVSTDGSPVQVWQGEDSLPAPAEIAYYARQ